MYNRDKNCVFAIILKYVLPPKPLPVYTRKGTLVMIGRIRVVFQTHWRRPICLDTSKLRTID